MRIMAGPVTRMKKPSKRGWRTVEADLSDYAGETVMLVLECVAPGKEVGAGGAFLDEFAIIQRR